MHSCFEFNAIRNNHWVTNLPKWMSLVFLRILDRDVGKPVRCLNKSLLAKYFTTVRRLQFYGIQPIETLPIHKKGDVRIPK